MKQLNWLSSCYQQWRKRLMLLSTVAMATDYRPEVAGWQLHPPQISDEPLDRLASADILWRGRCKLSVEVDGGES